MELKIAPRRPDPAPVLPEGWENVNGYEPRATLFEGVTVASIPYPDPEWVQLKES
jgi:hypothetical protein